MTGEGWVDYVFDRLVLLPGAYHLTACIYDQHILRPFDFRIGQRIDRKGVGQRSFHARHPKGALDARPGYGDPGLAPELAYEHPNQCEP